MLSRELMEGKIYLEAQGDIQFDVDQVPGCCEGFFDFLANFVPFQSFVKFVEVLAVLW